MRAEIISVGTELLLGQLQDTNAPYLAGHLASLGIDVFHISQSGDNRARLRELLTLAWSRGDLVVITGGMGPTEDDVTREAIADLLGETMTVQADLQAELEQRYLARSRTMPASNLKQATLIPSARAIPNPLGTAPGWLVEREGRMLVAMPGVPREMYRMWEAEIVPRLHQRQGEAIIKTRTLKVVGKGESAVEAMLSDLLPRTNPTIATYAKEDGIHVRLTAKAPDAEAAEAMLAPFEAEARAILGTLVYGSNGETLEGVVLRLLESKRLTLAVAEWPTGGAVVSRLRRAGAAASLLAGGVVASSQALAALTHAEIPASRDEATGRVAVARAAEAVGRLFGADIGLATLEGEADSAGGDGGHAGVYLGLFHAGAERDSLLLAPPGLTELQRFGAMGALNLLRRYLLA